MSYNLIFAKNAFSDIKKLDRVAQKRLSVKLKQFQTKPLFYAKKLTSSLIGQYRWRVGNYRIIFDLKGKDLIILKVGHRREIYR